MLTDGNVAMELPEPLLAALEPANALQRHAGRSRSIHGGLWTDLGNAHEILAQKLRDRSLSEQEAADLGYFIDNGYVVLKNLIPEHLVDALVEELGQIRRGEIPGHFVEYIENGQHFHSKPFGPELIGKRFKLIDLYARSESARQLSMYPGISRFLNLVFEQPPLAFQSLAFFTGSGQSIHQDTAYVRVSSPMELTATWIALEDIVEGTGELEFYAGSQRIRDFPFSGNPGRRGWFPPGNSKWFDRQNFEEHARYIRWLAEESARLGLPRRTFLARKGDVLFWTNDFAHGGADSSRPDRSRLSLVTHYCPLNRSPFYFYTRSHAPRTRYRDDAWYTFVEHTCEPLPLDFDDRRYLELNPDVKRAGMDARRHYLVYGRAEKRAYR